MNIRKTEPSDLSEIMAIFDGAKAFMRSQGNMNQWTNGYPGEEVILDDIQNGNSYVCMDGGQLAAVFSLIIGEDPAYRRIYDGQWLNDKPYGAIHRIAVNIRNKGVAFFCLAWCFAQCGNVKIDTHRDNTPMQKLLLNNGYAYCGVVYLDNGSERLAYQKTK